MTRAKVDPRGERIRRAGAVARMTDVQLRDLEENAPTAATRRKAREVGIVRSRAIQKELQNYLEVRKEIRVSFRRPRWMPKGVYRAILRTIVLEERA